MLLTKALSLVKLALSKADPELAVAENYDDVAAFGLAGLDSRSGVPTPFITIRALSGPFGGTAIGDGCSFTLTEGANCVEPSIELDEEAYPVVVVAREFVPDTAGPGKHRGGPATRLVVAPQTGVEMIYQLDQCRFPTQGVLGGGTGARASISVYRDGLESWASGAGLPQAEVVSGFAYSESGAPAPSEDEPGTEFRNSKGAGKPFAAGDVIAVHLPGGGGYGDPAERDPEALRKDIRDGLVTPGADGW